MTNIRNLVVTGLALGMLVAGLSACQKEGPAERAGKEVDNAVEKAGQQLEKAGQKLKDAVK